MKSWSKVVFFLENTADEINNLFQNDLQKRKGNGSKIRRRADNSKIRVQYFLKYNILKKVLIVKKTEDASVFIAIKFFSENLNYSELRWLLKAEGRAIYTWTVENCLGEIPILKCDLSL